MMAMASLGLTPGISARRSAAVSAAGPGPGSGDGTPSALMPQAAGMASRAASISSSTAVMDRSRNAMWSRWIRISLGVVAEEHALQGLLDGLPPARDLPAR